MQPPARADHAFVGGTESSANADTEPAQSPTKSILFWTIGDDRSGPAACNDQTGAPVDRSNAAITPFSVVDTTISPTTSGIDNEPAGSSGSPADDHRTGLVLRGSSFTRPPTKVSAESRRKRATGM